MHIDAEINADINVKVQKLVSIITVVFNNAEFIRNAIESVLSQNYSLIEYIVIDGGSVDGTLEIIKEYKDKISFIISEPDNGIYDALNKGIRIATGDVVAVLHSDDQFYNRFVVSEMMQKLSETKAELIFSDLVIVDGSSNKVLRYYMANYFSRWMLRIGWMPPHPTCFINKSLFNEFGLYSLKYKLAGDFDFLVRIFFGREIVWAYLDIITVKMRHGGISSSGPESKKIIANEIRRSLRSNQVWSHPIIQICRYFFRFLEIVIKPKDSKL